MKHLRKKFKWIPSSESLVGFFFVDACFFFPFLDVTLWVSALLAFFGFEVLLIVDRRDAILLVSSAFFLDLWDTVLAVGSSWIDSVSQLSCSSSESSLPLRFLVIWAPSPSFEANSSWKFLGYGNRRYNINLFSS